MASRATVVSLLPYELNPEFPGLIPSRYHLDAAEEGKFTYLVINDGHHSIAIPHQKEYMTVIDPSDQIAESVVRDHKNSCLGVDAETESFPGLFWFDGAPVSHFTDVKRIDPVKVYTEIATLQADKIKQARKEQNNWFLRLTKMADDDWARYHQHQMLTDIQRCAAKSLHAQGLISVKRDWALEINPETLVTCPGCRMNVHPEAAVCGSCKTIINEAKYKTLKFAGA